LNYTRNGVEGPGHIVPGWAALSKCESQRWQLFA